MSLGCWEGARLGREVSATGTSSSMEKEAMGARSALLHTRKAFSSLDMPWVSSTGHDGCRYRLGEHR